MYSTIPDPGDLSPEQTPKEEKAQSAPANAWHDTDSFSSLGAYLIDRLTRFLYLSLTGFFFQGDTVITGGHKHNTKETELPREFARVQPLGDNATPSASRRGYLIQSTTPKRAARFGVHLPSYRDSFSIALRVSTPAPGTATNGTVFFECSLYDYLVSSSVPVSSFSLGSVQKTAVSGNRVGYLLFSPPLSLGAFSSVRGLYWVGVEISAFVSAGHTALLEEIAIERGSF